MSSNICFAIDRSIVAILGSVLLAVMSVGCGGGRHIQATDGATDAPLDLGGDRAPAGPTCVDAGGAQKAMGQPCGCNGDCQSNFCVDGICCDSACTETCKACNVPATIGTCSFVPSGLKPRSITTCPKADVASCGLDGTCNGQGACRKYPSGTTCTPGMCEGDAVTGINVCDGAGLCRPGAAKVCAPFSCDAARKDCYPSCTKNSDCVSGRECVNNSCGPKNKGASCVRNEECASGSCADGVCCSVACTGACVSCNLVGHEGTCWPIEPGNPDPRAICKDGGAASCGQTGTCDGFGACAKYAAETVCIPPACTGDKLATAGTCDGVGSCRPPGVQNCPPYRCVNGACKTRCDSNADCQEGIACVNNSCGPKQNGQICANAGECQSANCVDGVCCADACIGACRSCALPSSLGRCTPIPAGNTDTRRNCTDQGAASCGNDGSCDGAGGCRKYRPGTVCAGERCAGNVFTAASTCSATGQCVAPTSRPCAPFGCNGQRCFDACSNNANCVPPSVCNGNSCGKKMNGADCSNGAECASNNCAQGVCCATACNTACKSCALPGSEGVCASVPTGSADPTGSCVDQGAPSCGTNGRCAAGACQRYPAGTSCKNPTCPSGTMMFTGRSTCDGAGRCATPEPTSCFPFTCGANACRSACSANADCSAGAVCVNGSCGLRPKGSPCASTNECSAGLVCSAQNVCCNAACDGACVSCTLSATLGTCAPVAANQNDPNGKCGVTGASTCGNDGKCDGNGACRKYPAGTQCVPPSCPGGTSTVTLARTCNGSGSCDGGGGTRTCAPFMCNGSTACNDTCTSNADCVAPNTCVGNRCGRKPAGAPCTAAEQCAANLFCTDGFCCSSNGCGDCKACNATGACQNADGMSCGANDKCHVEGMCVGGSCSSPTVSCDDNNPCTADSCNPQTGCVHAPVTGTACNDGDGCTSGDVCQAGACAGTPVTCAAPDQCHDAGVCQRSTGRCEYPNKPNDAPCNDGSACTRTDVCRAGVCTGTAPVVCTASDQCHNAGVCDPSSGVCTNPAKPNATPCNDGNSCTRTDTCQGGSCAGGNPVTCTASDSCHGAGTCNPANGMCTNPALADGTTCNDGSGCTQGESCQAGRCTGGTPKVCTASDQCHLAGVCDPSSGNCTNPAKPNGTTCTDGSLCTQGDVCQGGACVGASAVTCRPSDQCHVAGTCDPSSGACSNPAAPNGTTCNDGDACTRTDSCQSGTCAGGNPVVCAATDQCHLPGVCNRANGNCSNPEKPDGSTCSDDRICTISDVCRAGRCMGVQDPCEGPCLEGRCHPVQGCVPKRDSTPCSDQNMCTANDTCQAGLCAPGAGVTCPTGACDPAAGCPAANDPGALMSI